MDRREGSWALARVGVLWAGSGAQGCVPGRLPGLGSEGEAWNIPEVGSRSEKQMHSAPCPQVWFVLEIFKEPQASQ